MSNTILQGIVSFVNHEKQYVMIEYEINGKKKAINGIVDAKTQKQLLLDGIIKKIHQFHIGDTVNFIAKLADRGDKMVAANVQFLYNTALDELINKAKTENNFIGYLKLADDRIYVKEINSYLFFPITSSPWQMVYGEKELNEAVTFSLENTNNREKISAKLFNNNYIPEFYTAVKLHKAKTPINATVYKITPHGIYINIVEDKVQAKLPFDEAVKINDIITVLITHISPKKIVVEKMD